MIAVDEVVLDIALPGSSTGLVLMQPHFDYQEPPTEPFRWSDGAADRQLAAITHALEIAKLHHTGRTSEFTLFPEYSVPGLGGVELIDGVVKSAEWGSNTVVVAGVDGLTKDQYETVCGIGDTHFHSGNAPGMVAEDMWVNCCLVWTKSRTGAVSRWVQPKIHPCWLETNTRFKQMFRGTAVHVFRCQYDRDALPCRFFALICYDWIASHEGSSIRKAILRELNDRWAKCEDPTPRQIHWVFLIQQNPAPEHHLFLEGTRDFLTERSEFPYVDRTLATVIHANNAAAPDPCASGSGGASGLVCAPAMPFDMGRCMPTYTMRRRGCRDVLGRCHDVLLREAGACIHSLDARVAQFADSHAGDRTTPIVAAREYGLEISTDPRLSGQSVPASVKWVNDELDAISEIADGDWGDHPLRRVLNAEQSAVVEAHRGLPGEDLERRMDCSTWRDPGDGGRLEPTDAELWNRAERDGLTHLMHTLGILTSCIECEIDQSTLHATATDGTDVLEIVAISGPLHSDCVQHLARIMRSWRLNVNHPIVLVSRNSENERIVDVRLLMDIFGELAAIPVSYHTLVSESQVAISVADLENRLRGVLKDGEPRFV